MAAVLLFGTEVQSPPPRPPATLAVFQDAASKLSPRQAIANLQAAEAKYKSALVTVPGHAEASYNLATCLSEQADMRGELVGADAAAGEQVRRWILGFQGGESYVSLSACSDLCRSIKM